MTIPQKFLALKFLLESTQFKGLDKQRMLKLLDREDFETLSGKLDDILSDFHGSILPKIEEEVNSNFLSFFENFRVGFRVTEKKGPKRKINRKMVIIPHVTVEFDPLKPVFMDIPVSKILDHRIRDDGEKFIVANEKLDSLVRLRQYIDILKGCKPNIVDVSQKDAITKKREGYPILQFIDHPSNPVHDSLRKGISFGSQTLHEHFESCRASHSKK
jgi:hypothetical protein